MEDDDRPVIAYDVVECETTFMDPALGGKTMLMFRVAGSTDVVLEMSPQALASLEQALEILRTARQDASPLQ